MRRRHRRKTNRTAMAGYAVGLILGTAALGYAAYVTLDDPVADTFGCYQEGPQSDVILAIDSSPPRWNEEQQRAIWRFIDQLYASLRFNERLSIYTTEGDAYAALLSPQAEVCGTANDPRELDAIGASAPSIGYLTKEKDRLYTKHLEPELQSILVIEPEDARAQRYQSPILEMLQSLSRMPSFPDARRVILVSDFLQNSESARFCIVQNDMPTFANFTKRRAWHRVKPEPFDGIAVDFLMLQRPGYGGPTLPYCRDEEEIQDFFYDYAEHVGASSVRITRLRAGFSE